MIKVLKSYNQNQTIKKRERERKLNLFLEINEENKKDKNIWRKKRRNEKKK